MLNPIHILVEAFNHVVDEATTDASWWEKQKIAEQRALRLATSTTLIHAVHYLRTAN